MASPDGKADETATDSVEQAADDSAEQAETPSTTPSEDAKARFREALDRKNAASHRTADGSRNTGSVHASETAGQVQRMFRRKSG